RYQLKAIAYGEDGEVKAAIAQQRIGRGERFHQKYELRAIAAIVNRSWLVERAIAAPNGT
ncbi:MAG: hypothetical protein F6K28_50710, partial [Microcoleus sp. SIO2G3]|nr:hypothetical protein [Microcoleus sp. SIO2G3]